MNYCVPSMGSQGALILLSKGRSPHHLEIQFLKNPKETRRSIRGDSVGAWGEVGRILVEDRARGLRTGHEKAPRRTEVPRGASLRV